MVRVAFLDDDPVVRVGLRALLLVTPDLIPVGGAATDAELWPMLRRARPDVVVLDYRHPGRDGLQLCSLIKAGVLSPRVIIRSAQRQDALLIAAKLAGADGMVSKGGAQQELLEAVRTVGAGRSALPEISRHLVAKAASRLAPEEHALLSMRLAGTPDREIAAILRLDGGELRRRVNAMIGRLVPAPPAARAA